MGEERERGGGRERESRFFFRKDTLWEAGAYYITETANEFCSSLSLSLSLILFSSVPSPWSFFALSIAYSENSDNPHPSLPQGLLSVRNVVHAFLIRFSQNRWRKIQRTNIWFLQELKITSLNNHYLKFPMYTASRQASNVTKAMCYGNSLELRYNLAKLYRLSRK